MADPFGDVNGYVDGLRFYKGAGSSGSGLGLTIARSLVEAHGGTFCAESRAGAGTTITFSLPRGR